MKTVSLVALALCLAACTGYALGSRRQDQTAMTPAKLVAAAKALPAVPKSEEETVEGTGQARAIAADIVTDFRKYPTHAEQLHLLAATHDLELKYSKYRGLIARSPEGAVAYYNTESGPQMIEELKIAQNAEIIRLLGILVARGTPKP